VNANLEIVGESHYRLTCPDGRVVLDVDRLRRERHGLFGELVVRCDVAGAATVDGCLSIGTFNLSSPKARQDRARLLANQAKVSGLAWDRYLEELCQRVIAAERRGQPAVILRDIPRPSPAATLDVNGLPILTEHPQVLFGDGGTFKSYLALKIAAEMARQGRRVLFSDWESIGGEHRERLQRLCGKDMPADVLYARCDRPMVFEADRLRRLVRDNQVSFLICDSIAFACDGPPESAEVAGAYFRAIRQVGVGSLHIAHISKNGVGKGSDADYKPFGSVFWHNGARATWFVKRVSTSAGGQQIAVGLYNRKANFGPLRDPAGFVIRFEDERTCVDRISVADVDELAAEMPLWTRVRHALKEGPRPIHALAAELGANAESVGKAIRRRCCGATPLFTRLTGTDGVHLYALAEHRVG
jgi:hypothetical protein